MVHIGISDEGMPNYALKKLDNGFVVPDVSVADIHRNHRRQTRNQIEVAVAADELGYEYVVHPEHHFSLLGPISPNPVLIQTAVAERTEHVRLMQMANILPWHEPVRLAEQIAMLDVISDGRVEVGIGRGYGAREAATLGQYWGGTAEDDVRNQASFEETYEILRAAWTDDFVAHHGQFHDVPPTYTEWESEQEYRYLADDVSGHDPEEYMQVDAGTGATTLKSLPVFPQPQQDPHPQIWKPTMSPRSIEWAAHRGINGCIHCSSFPDGKERIDRYHEAAEEAGWPDHRPEYDGEPFRRGWDGRRRRGVAAILNVFNTEVADEDTFERWMLAQEYALSGKQSVRAKHADDIDAEEILADVDAPIVGDAEEIIDRLAAFRDTCGYEDFVVFVQTKVFAMSHEENVEQLRAFAEDVVPYFEEQSPEIA